MDRPDKGSFEDRLISHITAVEDYTSDTKNDVEKIEDSAKHIYGFLYRLESKFDIIRNYFIIVGIILFFILMTLIFIAQK